ncbi:RluA family pseudouridine synthase [Carboxydothermus pertinax]|uniref:Pseudouridine synthase n=1 Tax=Carboxydothermus pertinax TaxID=870242 RepID=A0A1L8CY84_9THEO|nr:RluA family pseudouridine synthase [Carboxydothermus pertinax]GAV23888.1 RNA pseudouridine synthase [Carboxydothermus pertinax]
MELRLAIKPEFIGKTVLHLLKSYGLSKRQLRKLKNHQAVYLNNQPVVLSQPIENQGQIVIKLPALPAEKYTETSIESLHKGDFLYEDEYLIIINKPAGILAHPVKYHPAPSVREAILSHYKQHSESFEGFYPIYRLDRNTSGPMLIAKYSLIAEMLNFHLKLGNIKKSYLALAEGQIVQQKGIIDLPLGLEPNSFIKRKASVSGKPALTKFQVLKLFPSHTLLLVEILTGRTHQIRAHFAAIGHPLAGDDLYGGKLNLLSRQALHLYRLSFFHPVFEETINLTCPLAGDFKEALLTLRQASGELL